jgi:hypothetical protein
MRTLLLFLLLCIAASATAQELPGTLNIGNDSFVLYNSKSTVKSFTVRMVNDSTLGVYDSTGTLRNFRIVSVVVSMTVDRNYVDQKVYGNILLPEIRTRLHALAPGEWLCFDQVVAEDESGKRYAFHGEKWVKQ